MEPHNQHESSDQIAGSPIREAIGGMDDRQIAALVRQMLEERCELAAEQKLLISQGRLVERTKASPDDIATRLREEVMEQAAAEVQMISARTSQSGVEVMNRVQRDCLASEMKWTQELDVLSVKHIKDYRLKLNDAVLRASQAILTRVEALKG